MFVSFAQTFLNLNIMSAGDLSTLSTRYGGHSEVVADLDLSGVFPPYLVIFWKLGHIPVATLTDRVFAIYMRK